ncbi:MAG: methyltransferase [Thaumarchaeota archaeon]|jgi:HemK-related putative methylase|nr:methyltransferase [Nitrososphaerota archaeon]
MVLDAVENVNAKRILEIGCGSGIVSLVLARRNVEVVAVDVAMEACKNTLDNFKRNRLQGVVHVVNGYLATAFRDNLVFDVVVSNPPYLPVDQSPVEDLSWAAGKDASFSKKLLKNVLPLLSDTGVLFLVQSSLSDVDGLKRTLEEKGFLVEEASFRSFFFEKIILFKIYRKHSSL